MLSMFWVKMGDLLDGYLGIMKKKKKKKKKEKKKKERKRERHGYSIRWGPQSTLRY
jgi:hypothetical protein